MKYYCVDCGEIFDESEIVVKYDDPSPSGVSLRPGAYAIDTCPWCGSDYLREAHVCECCGKAHTGENEKFCNDCESEMDNAINELCKRVQLRWKKESFGEAKSILFDRIEQRWDE